ncbi:MAG: hypothetical protein ACXV8A_05795 [Chthoniobacterales bacterium]
MNSPAVGLKLSALIFAVVTLAHGWRLIKGSEVIVGSHHIPLMLSVVAVVVGAILSIWMWKLSSHATRS